MEQGQIEFVPTTLRTGGKPQITARSQARDHRIQGNCQGTACESHEQDRETIRLVVHAKKRKNGGRLWFVGKAEG